MSSRVPETLNQSAGGEIELQPFVNATSDSRVIALTTPVTPFPQTAVYVNESQASLPGIDFGIYTCAYVTSEGSRLVPQSRPVCGVY